MGAVALKKLGYVPIHDDEISEVADVYRDMLSGATTMDEANVELGRRGFDAPMINLHKYVKWAAKAPDIKVIMTIRDKTKWAQSWLTVTPSAFIPKSMPFKWLKVMQDIAEFNLEVMVNVPTNGNPQLYQDIPTLEAGYEAWTQFVRDTVPSERLLEFDVRDGWGPLCDFLGKPIPNEPFPHINDRAVVDIIVKFFVLVTWIWPFLFAAPIFVIWYLISFCFGLKKRKSKTGKVD